MTTNHSAGVEPQCDAGCKIFTGGERHHYKTCPFYSESMSRIYDEMESTLNKIRSILNLKEGEDLVDKVERTLRAMRLANCKLKDIQEMFYGHRFEIANWHQNGNTEPMENFFEQNDWEPVMSHELPPTQPNNI